MITKITTISTVFLIFVALSDLSKISAQNKYRGGSFGELANQPRERGIVLHFMICLEFLLASEERKLGRRLNQQEYMLVRNGAPVIEMERADHLTINKCNNPVTYARYLQIRGSH